MDRSRGSQELAIGTDIDVPLSVVAEVAPGERAIRRWISFPHRDMRRDAFAQQPCEQFAVSAGGIVNRRGVWTPIGAVTPDIFRIRGNTGVNIAGRMTVN